jgi:hypothetical protein
MSADPPFIDQHPGDPQSWNLFAYVRNNPLRFVDPSGNAPQTSQPMLIAETTPQDTDPFRSVYGDDDENGVWERTEAGGLTGTFDSEAAARSAAAAAQSEQSEQQDQQSSTETGATGQDQTTHSANISVWPTGAGGFEHMGIGIDTDRTRGFSTEDPSIPWYKRLFGAPKGTVENDIEHHTHEDGTTAPHYHIRIPISADQARWMQEAIEKRMHEPGRYNLIFRSCAGYVQSILHAGQVRGVPHSEIFIPIVLAPLLAYENTFR